jgi:hypothetical protein
MLPLELLHWLFHNVSNNLTLPPWDPKALNESSNHTSPPWDPKARTKVVAAGKAWLLADLAVRIKHRLSNVVSLHLREDAGGRRRNRNKPEGIVECAGDIM